jgi:prepilin-type N-terminal cleavage/methylation domain-containing protein/prepilin-type processing-associated H-X9-DG protein
MLSRLKTHFHAHRSPRAFTLVELLVVIAIIGILIALLLPAVQAAREAARRIQCCNNVKQFALGIHNYHDANGSLPAGSYCTPGRIYACHTWFESLMPFIELGALYDQLDFNVPTNQTPNPSVILERKFGHLECPSDPLAGLLSHRRFADSGAPEGSHIAGSFSSSSMGASYVPNAGPVDVGWCPVPRWPDGRNCQPENMGHYDKGVPGLFAGGQVFYRFGDCTDGLSKTFLIGETLPSRAIHAMYFHSHRQMATTNIPPNYWRINPKGCPAEYLAVKYGGIPGCEDYMSGYNSQHPGGVQVAMADGSVHFVNEVIDYETWVFLGDRRDGEAIPFPPAD